MRNCCKKKCLSVNIFFMSVFCLPGFIWWSRQGSIQGIWGVKASPFQNAQLPPPKKILLSIWYIGNYIGKITQTRRGYCTHCNISQNCVSKCTRLHLSANSFQKISGGGGGRDLPPDPLGRLLLSATRDFSPKRQILDRSLHVLG